MRRIVTSPVETTKRSMIQVLDLLGSSDPRHVIDRAVQALTAGSLVALPADTSYVTVGLSANRSAEERLSRTADSRVITSLLFDSRESAGEYLPALSLLEERFVRRCWPGPVVLRFAEIESDDSGSEQIVSSFLIPESPVTRELIGLLPGPLAAQIPVQPEAAVGTPSAYVEASGDEVDLLIDGGPLTANQSPSVVDLDKTGWRIAHEGAVDAATLARYACHTLLFVCTGNTCRSPMAEAIFRKLLAERLECAPEELVARGFRVMSAGLSAAPQLPASPEAAQMMSNWNLSLKEHRSQPVTTALLAQADTIITMTEHHRSMILDYDMTLRDRVRTLASSGVDVSDPFGGSLQEYEECALQITRYVEEIIDEITPAGR